MQTRGHGPKEVELGPFSNFLTELAKRQAVEGAIPSLYGYHPATRAGLRAIYRNIAAVPLDVWTGPFGRPRRPARGRDADELRKLLRRPSPLYSGREAVKLEVIYSVMDGEANLVLRGADNAPVRSETERPYFFTVHPKRDLSQEGGSWRIDGKTLPFGALLQVKDPDPDKPSRGDGCRNAIQILAETDWYQRTYLKHYYKNGADPGGMLVSQLGMTKKQVENLLQEWNDRHEGPSRTNRVRVLHGGIRYEVPQQRHVDMELRQTLIQQRIDTLMTLGVPESEVGLTSEQTYANGLTANAGFWIQTLLPPMLDIEEAFNDPTVGLAQRYGEGLYVGFDLAQVREILKHVASKIDSLSKGVQSGVPLNVLIDFLGMDIAPIDGGDEPLVQAGLVPLRDVLDGTAAPAAASGPEDPKDAEEDDEDDPPAEGTKSLRARAAPVSLRRVRATKAVRRVDRARAAAQRDAATAVRGVVLELRDAVFARLDELEDAATPRGIRAVPDPDALLGGLADLVKSIDDAMTPVFEDAVVAAAGTVEAERGQDLAVFDLQHPQITRFVNRMRNNIKSVPVEMAARIRDEVAQSVAANEDFAALRKRLTSAFQLESRHATTIAQQEAGEAVNGGRFETMALEGVTRHSWSHFPSPGQRENHAAIDGEVVPIGEKFSIGLRFPNDPEAPAEEVVGCRCVALAED